MSKASQIIVLCEDKAHDVFVTRFLKKEWKWKGRDIRVRPYPGRVGSGKTHVQAKVREEANALRCRQASTILFVVHDADEQSVGQVKEILDANIIPRRGAREPIVFIVPKWHIETWVAYLDNKAVDEFEKHAYKRDYRETAESKRVHPFVDRLAGQCKENKELESPPNSLVEACKEFERIRSVL